MEVAAQSEALQVLGLRNRQLKVEWVVGKATADLLPPNKLVVIAVNAEAQELRRSPKPEHRTIVPEQGVTQGVKRKRFFDPKELFDGFTWVVEGKKSPHPQEA
jgi:hypothetical protein